jgi:hypothetical protein
MVGIMVAVLIFLGGTAYGLHIAGKGGGDWRRGPGEDPPLVPPPDDPGGLSVPDTIPFWMHVEEDLRRVTLAETSAPVG